MRTQASSIPARRHRERRFDLTASHSVDPPLRPDNLEQLRKQAKQLLRSARAGDQTALGRFAAVHGAVQSDPLRLSQAQLVVAREAGFSSWPSLHGEATWRQEARTKHRLGTTTPLLPGEAMNTDESLKLQAIDQIGLTCTDLDEAERFYCGVLGLELSGDVPGVMKFFACDGVNIVMFRSDVVAPNSIIYFRVPPTPGLIERQLGTLTSKGVGVESDAHIIARNWNGCDVWVAFFRDPFGNLLGLKSDVPVK
jgi:catechol 2,3-dioxygenase-like lactoylglutathione lyase family enzyme